MSRPKWYKVHEVLAMLEDDSDFTKAVMYISPPTDPNCSDEDSDDEDCGMADNFTRRQLEAEAEVKILKGGRQIRIGGDEADEENNGDVDAENFLNSSAATTSMSLSQAILTSKSEETQSRETSSAAVVCATQASLLIAPNPVHGITSDDATGTRRSGRVICRRPRQTTANSQQLQASKSSKTPRNISSVIDQGLSGGSIIKTTVTKSTKKRQKHSCSVSSDSILLEAPYSKRRNEKKVARKWIKKDMPQERSSVSEISANHDVDVDYSPAVLFEMFMDDEPVQLLAENTNRYASQKGNHSFQVSPGEIRLFMAILFTSGYAPLPRRRLYWEPSDDVYNAAISRAMTRNRFEELMQFIHVADNHNLAPNDRMAKVRPLFNALNLKFLEHFPAITNLAVDESMVPYYGRHSAKQFIRGKPIRYGYKVWSLNTPLGYCVQLEPYQGAGVTDPQLGLGCSVVVNLVGKLPPKSYVVYFDNFFTSLKLLQQLSERNMHATGTVRSNRIEDCPLPPVDQFKKTTRGSFDYRMDTQSSIIVVRWNDNSVVTLASNCHGVHPLGSALRWSRAEKKQINIEQPFLIRMYNLNMGGVDRMDQNISTYRIAIRSKKWWWPLFAYLLDVAMQNSWILYRLTEADKHRPLDQLDYRRDLCTVYYKRYALERPAIGRSLGRPKQLGKRVPEEIRTDRLEHYIQAISTQRRCAVCGLKVRKQCQKCLVGLHLEYFALFHKFYQK